MDDWVTVRLKYQTCSIFLNDDCYHTVANTIEVSWEPVPAVLLPCTADFSFQLTSVISECCAYPVTEYMNVNAHLSVLNKRNVPKHYCVNCS